jgi:hypothetical protein
MRYWWVNQNQTFRQEIDGGYLWSPKRNKNGHRNPFYEFMREVAPGDIVFSFVDTRIGALGIVSGYCRESPKPEEFGTAGTNWSQIGWRVGVRWQRLSNSVRPKDHIARLRPDLGDKYAPLTPDGNGLQSVYLTQISAGFASTLFALTEPRRIAWPMWAARFVRSSAIRPRPSGTSKNGNDAWRLTSTATTPCQRPRRRHWCRRVAGRVDSGAMSARLSEPAGSPGSSAWSI